MVFSELALSGCCHVHICVSVISPDLPCEIALERVFEI